MPSIFKVIFGLALILGGIAVASKFANSAQRSGGTVAADPTIPPANATFVEASAEDILGDVATAKKGVRDQVAASYQGLWVPSTGWESEVVDVTSERGGTAVRMQQTSNSFLGGSFYIVALCPTLDQEVKKGDRATVQGRIKSVDLLPAAAVPMYRILLHDCRVLKVGK